MTDPATSPSPPDLTWGHELKELLSPGFRREMRERRERIHDWLDVFLFRLRFALDQKPVPERILYFGYSPGDDLLCTAVLHELRNRGNEDTMMVSNHPDLFAGNGNLAVIQPLWKRYSQDASTVAICQRFAKLWGVEFRRLFYAPLVPNEDRSLSPSRHIIAELCASAGITGKITIRPYLTLLENETRLASWATNHIVIQSSGLAARHPILNKQWFDGRFQEVVDALVGKVKFVQLGSLTDPLLHGAHDLRGKTTIRQSAAILSNARLFIGGVGFLMHVARAVECPSVIVFGGREAPWQTGYNCNANLYSDVACAPCWRWNSCDFERKCMAQIVPSDVVSAVDGMLAHSRGPLLAQTIDI